jgi:hypothetical protein
VKSIVEVLFDRRAPKRTLAIHSLKLDMSLKVSEVMSFELVS